MLTLNASVLIFQNISYTNANVLKHVLQRNVKVAFMLKGNRDCQMTPNFHWFYR